MAICMNQVDVYYFKVSDASDNQENPKEMVSRFVQEKLIRVVSQKFNIPTDKLITARDVLGKPFFLKFPEIYFNISHSGEYGMFGISDIPVGVDIEKADKADFRIMKRVFSDNEIAYTQNEIEKFYQIWTRKEAFVKHSGEGISGIFKKPVIDVLKEEISDKFKSIMIDQYVMTVFTESHNYIANWDNIGRDVLL